MSTLSLSTNKYNAKFYVSRPNWIIFFRTPTLDFVRSVCEAVLGDMYSLVSVDTLRWVGSVYLWS